MAMPNFDVDNFTGKRYFEIVDLSFSPETVAYGEKTKMTVTIKNTSGAKVSNVCVWGFPRIPAQQYTVGSVSVTYQNLDGVDFYLAGTNWSSGFASVSWANNENKTFAGEITIFAEPSPQMDLIDLNQYKWGVVNGPTWEGHVTPDEFGIALRVYQPNGDNSSCQNANNQGQDDELLHILSYRDKPKISLNAERSADGVPNDEGVNLLSDIALSFDTDTALEHGYTASLTCTPTPEALTLNATPEQMAAGIVDSATAIEGVLNNGVDYELSLTVTNGYESAESKISIPKAFANVHLSGASTGGVCFGGFSSASEGNPLFECYYPALFKGGVDGLFEVAQATMLSGFATPGEWGHPLTFLKIGNVVFVSGTIRRNKAGKTDICEIPDGFVPKRNAYLMCACTGSRLARIDVNPNGIMNVSWYHYTNTTTNDTGTFIWVSLSGLYLLD